MQRIGKRLALAFILSLPLAAAAQVYTWTDAHGTVHYSQWPPAQGVKYRMLKPHRSQTVSGAGSKASSPASANTAAVASGQQADTSGQHQRLCKKIQTRIKRLSDTAITSAADLKRKPLSPSQRAAKLKRAQAEHQHLCGPT